MEPIRIPCPKCGRELKLRDRSLLGRKGKCPKCEHAFVMQEPASAKPASAKPDSAEAATKPAAKAPSVSANWTPTLPSAGSAPKAPDRANAFKSSVEEKGSQDDVVFAAAPPELIEAPPETAPVPERSPFDFTSKPAPVTDPSDLSSIGANESMGARLRARQKQKAARRNLFLAIGILGLAALGGGGFWIMSTTNPTVAGGKPGPTVKQPPKQPPGETVAKNGKNGASTSDTSGIGLAAGLSKDSPTSGKPIELQYIPFGTQIMVNFRPADIWKDQSPGEEVMRGCLKPVADWMEVVLKDLFKRKPQEIEEVQLCLLPGTQGSMPDIAAVAHLADDLKMSKFIDDFPGEKVDDHGYPVHLVGERAYMIPNQKTIAVCPKGQASEMVSAIDGRNPARDIDELLPMTDRDRHITVLFIPRVVRLHGNYWFSDQVKLLTTRLCDWLGDEVESVGWSFHFGEKQFHSEMLFRNVTGIQTGRLERELKGKLDVLPKDLLSTVRMMNPKEIGKRKVIGRLPKMSEAYAMSTFAEHGPRFVKFTTPLPERGGPNLALGSLLAWDEATRTDFTKKVTKPLPTDSGTKLPDLIADRLKMKIDADFRREPLQGAIAYIGGEIKTTIDIDGDALKFGGFTKNMPQEFKLEQAPAKAVIAKILEKYQDTKPDKTMVIVVDEAKKMILVTTKASCEQKNLTPFDVFK